MTGFLQGWEDDVDHDDYGGNGDNGDEDDTTSEAA